MSNLLKSKLLVGVLVVAIAFVGVFALIGAGKANAATCSITTTLKQGVRSADVECLQDLLNVTPQTGYFGTITKAAVIAFQTNHGLKADGIVGAMTRAALLGTTTTQGNCPAGYVAVTPVAPTFAACVLATPAPQGNCPVGYVAITPVAPTFAACQLSTTVITNGEGSVTVTANPTPASGLAINRGETKAAEALKVKAEGSDMKVTRVWLDINTRIWLSASQVDLLDGSTIVASLPLSASTVTEVTVGSAWRLEFNNLNIVVPAGTTKILTFNVTRPAATSNNDSTTVAATSTLRAIDMAGLTDTYTLPAFTWNLANATAQAGSLTDTLNVSSPSAQSVSGLSTTAGTTTAVKMMDFDLKAKDGSINVSAIAGHYDDTAGHNLSHGISTVELRDSSGTVLDSVASTDTATTGNFSFTELNLDIPAGTTKTLSVWFMMNPIGTEGVGYTEKADGYYALVDSITATTGTNFTAANNTTTVTGYTQYMFQYAPTFAVGAGTVATQVEGSAVGKKAANITFNLVVTAPSGSDVYVNATDGMLCGGTYPVTKINGATGTGVACDSATVGGTMITSLAVSGASSKGTGTLATWDKVSAGQSRVFTINAYIPDGNAAGFTGLMFGTNGIQWADADNVTIATDAVVQTWGMSDLKTNTVSVTA